MNTTLRRAAPCAFALLLLACRRPPRASQQAPEGSLASASAGTSADPSKSVTFTRRVPLPGFKAKRNRDLGFQLSREGVAIRHTAHEAFRYDVKKADESRITQAGLDVEDLYESNQQAEEAEDKAINPLSGQRFVVTRQADGKLSAQNAAGAPASEEQASLIEQYFGDLFEADKVSAFLPKGSISVGEKLKPTRAALLELLQLEDDVDTTIDGVDFTLASTDRDQATFALGMTMTWSMGAGFRLRARLSGTVSLETKAAQVKAVELAGPVVVLDPKGEELGTGQFRSKLEVSLESS